MVTGSRNVGMYLVLFSSVGIIVVKMENEISQLNKERL